MTRARVRRWAPVVGVLVVVVALAALTLRAPDSGLPLAPDSTGPGGTWALVEILRGVGADVAVVDGDLPEDTQAALLLVDNIGDARRASLLEVASGGGTLVVADPSSPLAPDPVGATSLGILETTLPRDCELPALAAAERVLVPGGLTFEVGEAGVGCYARGEGRWLVATPEGDGSLVVLGGPSALTNAEIGSADNAVLAAALLAPEPGTRVAIVRPDFAAQDQAGAGGLLDLVPDGVVLAAWQLLIAFAIVVLWRARRLGKPVREPQAVALPGSELVVAVGNLMEHTGAETRAAAIMRQDLHRDLARRLGLAPGVDVRELAAAAERAGASGDDVRAALTADDSAVVDIAARVEEVRASIGPTPVGAAEETRNRT